MSGPKSADYYLTPEQRRQLAEQRRVNELKKMIEKYSACCAYSQSVLDEYSSHAKELMEAASTDNGYSELFTQIDSVLRELKSSLANVGNLNDSSSLSDTYNNLKALNRKKEYTLSLMKKADTQNISMLKKMYANQLENAMSADFSDIKSQSQAELEEILGKIGETLQKARNIPNISAELIAETNAAEERAKTIKDVSILRNFRAISVEPLLKRCTEYSELYTEFQDIFSEYQAVCETENIPVRKFNCCREDISEIKKLLEEMRLSAAKADEQEYISTSIDEVMAEMGYKLIGNRSVTKKSGRKFHSELYTFSEGTAVNITHASNGQITMELAGIDSIDRQPNDDESNMLYSEMENFCGAFSEFEKKLAEKGVVSRHISILPPALEYAQIINVNDYEISGNADYSEIKSGKRTEAKKSGRME